MIRKITAIAALSFSVGLQAQESDVSTLASWVALDAPTGHEHLATNAIISTYSGWQKDDYGNLVKKTGEGQPHTVVACALDAYSYAVSQVTTNGYLRLHRIGAGSRHPLWDQAHEGQQLRILTRQGPLVGVSAVANGHFAAQHRDETAIITQDDLWLDVGAESNAQVADMGISLLDPVIRSLPAWGYANEAAGPRAGARIGCAALLAAAEAGISTGSGTTTYVMSVQQVFGWVGLGAALSRDMTARKLIVLAPGEESFRNETVTELPGRVDSVLLDLTRQDMRIIAPEVLDPDALMERVSLDSANELLSALVEAIESDAGLPRWLPAPQRRTELNASRYRINLGQEEQRVAEVAGTLDRLAESYGVPGHEGSVRNIIYNAMPEWARQLAQVDDMGNLWVEFGPVSQAAVFVAHMDEVGFEVESMDGNGVVNLRRLGGAVSTAWEGQPAVLELDSGSDIDSDPEAPLLRGVFLTRSDPQQKQPQNIRAWFGMNSEQLAAAGVVDGMGVTIYKEGHRMGPYRYAARSMDDRVGSTALLLALQDIDPAQLDHRVIFAWSVREEGGLRGAARLASQYGRLSRRVYSVDTFVTSDTPLESPHFAYAPLGRGPVLRSIENSSMATPYELDRNRRIATDAGLEHQFGLTQGGTDGTTFTPYGAPNAGLSWPGRYSHSPAEIADLRDIAGLIELIRAMAEAPLD